jgi:hypothetical protein
VGYSWVVSGSGGCIYTWTVSNGTFQAVGGGILSNGNHTITGNTLTQVSVIWDNVVATANSGESSGYSAPTGSLAVTANSCGTGSGGSQTLGGSLLFIKTLNGVTPGAISFTGAPNLAYCITAALTLSVPQTQLPSTNNTTYGTTRYADAYEWTIPSGWSYNGTTSNGTTPIATTTTTSLAVTPSGCGGGQIKVRAKLTCNANLFSNYQTRTVTRTPAALSVTPPSGYTQALCNVTTPVTFTATSLACASGYKWTIPSGWISGGVVSNGTNTYSTGTTNSITVTPNGSSAGSIGSTATLNCGATISGSYAITYNGSAPYPVFSPSNPICVSFSSSGTFSVSGYTEYDWYVNNGLLVNGVAATSTSPVHTTTGSATITAPASGFNGTIYVRSHQGNCLSTYVQSSIAIGGPNNVSITGPYTCVSPRSTFLVNGSAAFASSYTWIVSPPFTALGGGGSSIYIQAPSSYGSGTIQMKATNSCGSNYSNVLYVNTCGSSFALTTLPNPASDYLEMKVERNQLALEGATMETDATPIPEFEVKLYDKYNQVRKSITVKGKIRMNISSLPEDTYFLIATNGKEIIRKQIVIKH